MAIHFVLPLENQPHARICYPAYLLPFPIPDQLYNTTNYQSAISKIILFYFILLFYKCVKTVDHFFYLVYPYKNIF